MTPPANQPDPPTGPQPSDPGVTQVVVVIVCYNGRAYLDDCLNALLGSDDPGVVTHIVVVDNASTDGSADYIARAFPRVDLLTPGANLGYAGGANAGWRYARQAYPDAAYLAVLNQDAIVARHGLGPLVGLLDQRPDVAVAQPKILLHPQTHKINTAGNRSHYLGFGFVTGYGQTDRGQYDQTRSIDFASGAAMLVRTAVLEQVGLFDDIFFMYLEDADLSWKLRQIGLETCFVPSSVVYHQYSPGAPFKHYYYLERNRWLMLLTYYKAATLVLLAPPLLVMELGQLWFAVRHRQLCAKLRSYVYFWRPRNLRALWRRRRDTQRRRTQPDRRCVARFGGTIDFEPLNSPLLRCVGNPLLNAYWQVVRRVIVW